ncbi:MAG: class I SAM-dependent methyltransferase [Planctomycetota bacterium]
MAEPLYDSIGCRYGETRRADPFLTETIVQALHVEQGGDFLDLACGTGNYTCAVSERGGRWTGIDISETMLDQARKKSERIAWIRGSADRLPFEDASFDGVLCTLAIHHFSELESPFREVARVLRSGPFVLFTSYPEQTASYWLHRYFPRMIERSAAQLPSRASILTALHGAGFEIVEERPYSVKPDLQDLFLYSGKFHPERYLDPAFRANISSFSALCSPEELRSGLARLGDDLGRGALEPEPDSRGDGDYTFVISRQDGR